MSRLIDADKLERAISSSLNTGRETFSPEIIYEAVDEQPTAFDADEVVRQIKDIKDKEYAACTDQKCGYCEYLSTCSCGDKADKLALDCAIKIVKSGGIKWAD